MFRTRPRRPAFRPRLECLEGRTLLTATNTALALTPNASLVGQSVVFTAVLTGGDLVSGTAGGTVTFQIDGTTPPGGVVTPAGTGGPDNQSRAEFTAAASLLPVGTHTITARYGGEVLDVFSPFDPLHVFPPIQTLTNDPSSDTQVQAVNKLPSATTLTVSPDPSLVGQEVTLTAVVAGVPPLPPGTGTPGGSIAFKDGETTLASVALDDTGRAVFKTSALAAGAHGLTAVYGGDDAFATSTAIAVPTQTNRNPTITALASSSASAVVGQPVTFTATVTPALTDRGAPGGSVLFLDGVTPLGDPAPLDAAGVARLSTSALGLGPHGVTAVYGGDATFAPSDAPGLTETVAAAGTATRLVPSSGNPAAFGQPVTVTATVTALAPGSGTPTGAITLEDNGSPLFSLVGTDAGAGVLKATFTTAALGAGRHALTAAYGGDPDFTAGASAPFTLQIDKADASVTFLSPAAPPVPGAPVAAGVTSVRGQPVTFLVRVSAAAPGGGSPTGEVTFFDGGVPLGAGAMNGLGLATFGTTALAVGAHTITARYGGDDDFDATPPGSAANLAQQVNRAATATALHSPADQALFDRPLTLTARVAAVAPGAGAPAGAVTFLDGGTPLGDPVPLDAAGQATLVTRRLAPGPHLLTASYGGDGDFLGSTSAGLPLPVIDAPTTTSLTSSSRRPVFGAPLTLRAAVASPDAGAAGPTGAVRFFDNGRLLAAVALESSGQATLTGPALAAGGHTITARYGGDGAFLPSGGTLTLRVGPRTLLARILLPGGKRTPLARVFDGPAGGGPGPGVTPVQVFDGPTGAFKYQVAVPAVRPGRGLVFTTLGDVTGDGVDDLVVVAELAGGGVQIRAYDGATGALLRAPAPFGTAFRGVVRVALADLDGDGASEVVARARVGGRLTFRAFRGRTLRRGDGLLLPRLAFV